MDVKLLAITHALHEYEERLENIRRPLVGTLVDTLEEDRLIELHVMLKIKELEAMKMAIKWVRNEDNLTVPTPKL